MRAAADAAAVTMQAEIAADVAPPPRTDPKIAVLNLLQASPAASLCPSPAAAPCLLHPVMPQDCSSPADKLYHWFSR